MALSYSEQEGLVQKAIDEYEDGKFRSASAAAKHFKLDPRRVQRRLRGQASRSTREPTHTRLTKAQEQSLCDYIDHLDHVEHSIRIKHIQSAAEYILKTAAAPNTPLVPLGRDWATRFIKRHPKYIKCKQKPLSIESENAHDDQSIREAYERFRAGCEEKAKADVQA